MSVKYRKVVNNRKNSKTQGKVYGRAVVDGVIDTKEIARKINKRCTLTEPDIIAVINALETEIGYGLSDGKRVVLDGFGSFKVGLTTTPADSAKKFTSANIKGMHVIFLPATEMEQGKRVKNMLKGVKAEEMTEYTGIVSGDNTSNAGNTDSGKTDPGKTDSGKTDSGKTDSGKTDSGKTDSGKTDSGKTDSGSTDSGDVGL